MKEGKTGFEKVVDVGLKVGLIGVVGLFLGNIGLGVINNIN
jgi:hypothetical protein